MESKEDGGDYHEQGACVGNKCHARGNIWLNV